jgi:hypothetical protein
MRAELVEACALRQAQGTYSQAQGTMRAELVEACALRQAQGT